MPLELCCPARCSPLPGVRLTLDAQVPDLQQLMEGGQPVVYDHTVSPLVLLLHTPQRVHRQVYSLRPRVHRRRLPRTWAGSVCRLMGLPTPAITYTYKVANCLTHYAQRLGLRGNHALFFDLGITDRSRSQSLSLRSSYFSAFLVPCVVSR